MNQRASYEENAANSVESAIANRQSSSAGSMPSPNDEYVVAQTSQKAQKLSNLMPPIVHPPEQVNIYAKHDNFYILIEQGQQPFMGAAHGNFFSFFEQEQSLMGRTVYASAQIGSASSLVADATVERMKGRRTGPVQVLNKIVKDWTLSDAEQARLLAYPDTQSAADLLAGRISLRDADREDRVRLLYGIYRILFSLFPEPLDQQNWLRGANQNLRNKSPLEHMMEHRIPGMVSVKNLVERLAGR
jgi:hypothetical protein